MRYRILRNECKKYRIEKQQFDQEWELLEQRTFATGAPGSKIETLEFTTYQAARDHIQELIEAPEWERKRNAWSVVETVEGAPDEQENP